MKTDEQYWRECEMAHAVESAVRFVRSMRGVVWAEGNEIRVRCAESTDAGMVVRLEP